MFYWYCIYLCCELPWEPPLGSVRWVINSRKKENSIFDGSFSHLSHCMMLQSVSVRLERVNLLLKTSLRQGGSQPSPTSDTDQTHCLHSAKLLHCVLGFTDNRKFTNLLPVCNRCFSHMERKKNVLQKLHVRELTLKLVTFLFIWATAHR